MSRWLRICIVLSFFLFFWSSSVYAAKLAEKDFEEKGRLVTMDFEGVELTTLIKFVGELTGKNFVIDERVRGKATVISPTKITVEEAYKVFESILEVHGFTTVPAGKVIKVVPAIEARGKSLTTRVGAKAFPAADRMITQVIPIKYTDVNDVRTLLTPLISKNSLLVAYKPTNTLIVTDVLSNVNKLLKILQEVDIPGYELQLTVVPLKYASAKVIAEELRILFEARKMARAARAPTPKVQKVSEIGAEEELKIIPDERTNAIIILATAQTIKMIRGIIEKLDQEIPIGKGYIHIYYLQHAVSEDLAKVLSGVAEEVKEGTKAGAPAAKGKASILGEEISIIADKPTNALIIVASPQDYAVLEEMIKKLDIVRAQVYVEALIAEVTLDKIKELGVEWNITEEAKSGKVKRYGGSDFGLIDAERAGALTGLIIGITKGYIPVGGVNVPDIKALLNFYSEDSDVNVLSTPRLLTTDNEKAEIIVGEERPFLQSSQVTPEGSTVRTWEYKDVGITLRITPHISKGKLLRLEIFTEIKGFLEELAGEVGAVVTTKRQASTSVIVEDGSTVVIGGLIRDDKTARVSKIPLLGDLPLLGWLFKARRQTKVKTNLLIFITPSVVASAEDLRKITEKEQEAREKHVDQYYQEKKKMFPIFEDDYSPPAREGEEETAAQVSPAISEAQKETREEIPLLAKEGEKATVTEEEKKEEFAQHYSEDKEIFPPFDYEFFPPVREAAQERVEEVPPVISEAEKEIREEVLLAAKEVEKDVREELVPARNLTEISIDRSHEDMVVLKVRADGRLGDYRSFILKKPTRLVIDISNIKRKFPKRSIGIDSPYVKKVRLGDYAQKVRVVLDIPTETFPYYLINHGGDELWIALGNKAKVQATILEKGGIKEEQAPPLESRNHELSGEITGKVAY